MITNAPPIHMPSLTAPLPIVRHHAVRMGVIPGPFPTRELRRAGCTVNVKVSKSGFVIGTWGCPKGVNDQAIIDRAAAKVSGWDA